jgi:hypothetical protein
MSCEIAEDCKRGAYEKLLIDKRRFGVIKNRNYRNCIRYRSSFAEFAVVNDAMIGQVSRPL